MKKIGSRKKRFLCTVLSAVMLASSINVGAAPVYKDGTYSGTAKGRNGDITVSVTVSGGIISAIDVTDQQETPSYWESAKEIIPNIISAGQTDGVDAISGATISSEAIKKAVDDALSHGVDSGFFESGSGSVSDPYVITTPSQLAAFADSVDNGENYINKYITLGADIDLSGIDNWNPIGAEGTASANLDKIFAGDLDGQGHVINGLTIKTDEPYTAETNVGLFSTLSSTASVSGIRLENVFINVSGTSKVVRAGGITGDITSKAVSKQESRAKVDNCFADGFILAETDTAMVMTGGIAGRASGNAVFSNCISQAEIFSISNTKTAYGAGIVSMAGNDTFVVNCANRGNITVLTSNGFSLYAGGVVGMMTSKQYNCFSTGDVTVGTIDASDAMKNAGTLNGALMPAASGEYDYCVSGAAVYFMDEVTSASAISTAAYGPGSMNPEGTFAPNEIPNDEVDSEGFAYTLNENLYAIEKLLKQDEADIELRLWQLSSSGKTEISDEVFVNDVIDASVFESGSGTKESPFKIKTADQLRAFSHSLSEKIDYTGVYVELMNDIDISGEEWTPVGDNSFVFNGSFDGKGHTVSGMTVGSETAAKELETGENYIGFFSVLGTNAVVKNVELTNVVINVTYNASAYAGGIAAAMTSDDSGYKGAVVDSCSVSGKITVTSDTGNNFVGGAAAYVYKGAIINCKTDVDARCIVKTGGAFGETGGISALVNRGLVANCYSLGNVYASGSREDEGMAVASSLVAVNAGYLVNSYGNGSHETNDYSVYTGAVSGWITGIGHTYDCYYNGEASMKIGNAAVDPVADVGTRVSSGVSDDGMVYTGGVVYNNEAYTSETYSKLADKLNANFSEFPTELTQFGLTNDSLKNWKYENEVTFGDSYASAVYVQPAAEIVEKPELTLNDGTWYGRDSEKKVVVSITVENGEITNTISSDGSTGGDAYDEALQTAKDKATYNDKTTYEPADTSRFSGGSGTENDPYIINTEEQLRYVAEAMIEDVDWENVWFALGSDITLTGGNWLPIGHAIQAEINGKKENFAVYPFRGNFDGQGHTVSSLTIGSKDAPADIYLSGLFGLAAGDHATNLTPEEGERLVHIKNIKLENVSINVNSRYEANAGGLVAWAQNGFVIDNCSVTGEINVMARESFGRVGGLVGSTLRGVITDSFTDVTINAATETSSVYAGGLAGMTNRSAQVNCFTLGSTSADAQSNNKAMVGGLTGMSGGTNINCYTYGDVQSLITTVDVGGINGRSAGIAADHNCFFNSSAAQKAAGRDVEKKASGTLVGGEISTSAKTADEMSTASFVETLNTNRANMTEILKDVSTYLEDMTENSKEGLSHLLFYTNDGSDLNLWTSGSASPVFAENNTNEKAELIAEKFSDNSINFTASVDSLDYTEVGFILEANGKEVRRSTKTVYANIQGSKYTANDLEGNFVYAFEVSDIENSGTEIKVTPYRIDLNGNETRGESKVYSLASLG